MGRKTLLKQEPLKWGFEVAGGVWLNSEYSKSKWGLNQKQDGGSVGGKIAKRKHQGQRRILGNQT